MSTFWSRWVVILIAINLGIALFLFVWGQLTKIPTEADGTTGHVWAHGVLRESVRKLPLWWLLMSIVAFIAAFTYFALYPGLGNYKGSLGWTQTNQFERDTTINNAKIEAQIKPFRNSTAIAGSSRIRLCPDYIPASRTSNPSAMTRTATVCLCSTVR